MAPEDHYEHASPGFTGEMPPVDHRSSWPTVSWEEIAKICLITGDEDMLACSDNGGNHQVGIAFPLAMLLPEAYHHGRTGGVEHDDLELREHVLRV